MVAKQRFSRKDLNKPDDFISASDLFLNFCKTNKGLILSFVLTIIIGSGGALIYWKSQKTQAIRMESLLHKMKEIQVQGEKNQKLIEILSDFNEGVHKNRARMILADSYFKQKNNVGAIKVYKEILSRTPSNGLISDLARLGLAHSHEQNNDRQEAILIYKSLIDKESSLPLFQIYFSLVRVYEMERDYKNALLTLREMENQFKGHSQYDQVVRKIRGLDGLA